MTAKALNQREDIDFMSETAAAAMQGPPGYSHAIVWTTFAFIAAFVVWAAYANIGETTVGEGKGPSAVEVGRYGPLGRRHVRSMDVSGTVGGWRA